MPKKVAELSPVEVRHLSGRGTYYVGGVSGLLLQISKTGSKSWILRVNVGKARRNIGLGGFPDVSLAEARQKARKKRELIERGIDPIAERLAAQARLKANQGITFDQARDQALQLKAKEFRNTKHVQQWHRTLEVYASPIIGKLPVSDVSLDHVVSILEPIWLVKTETASRVRGRIEYVLSWATVRSYRQGLNPARWRGNLDAILPKPSKVTKVQHFKALAIDDIPGFFAALHQRTGFAARAVELVVLTACRSGEIRGACWAEIDLKARAWTVPATRMKIEREHRIPLSDPAIAILHQLPRLAGSDLVFPSAQGRPLSDATLAAVLKRMGVDATVHGLRSTFRDWCSERTAYSRDVAEMALAHAIADKTEAAYRRGDLFAKRARLMADWARFCVEGSEAGTVTPIGVANIEPR